MVAVIVNQSKATRLLQELHFAITLEAPANSLEVGQSALHSSVINTQLHRYRNRGQCIQDIVQTWQVQSDGKIR